MIQRKVAPLAAIALLVPGLFAQEKKTPAPKKSTTSGGQPGTRIQSTRDRRFPTPTGWVETSASKNDWEEINFEFNSSIISDGFPTLLWLADFLRSNSGYRVKVTGHTDFVGSAPYNDRLGLARATAVRDFLVKYGASANQIAADGEGKRRPEVDNRTKEGRFVNRRVVLTVTDPNGRQMSLEDLIASKVKPTGKGPQDCCDEILKRLDKLNDVLAALNDLKKQNADLNSRLNDLENAQRNLQRQVAGLPDRQQVTDIARKEGDVTAGKAANEAFEKAVTNNRKFSLLGLNVGPTFGDGRTGNFTFSGKGRFFSPFGNGQLPGAFGTHAVQAEGEYMYYPGRQEGQFDLGLVNRWNRVQAGLFSSFKYVNFRQYQSGGTLGQAAFAFDYLFSRGRIGFFGTKGFRDNVVINRAQLGTHAFTETYLKIVDQVGGSAQVGLWGDAYLEGNLGYLKRHARDLGDRPGGTLKFVQPLSDRFAATAEFGWNETFLNAKDSGRLVFGFEFGNWMRPKQYLATTQPVPMDIPRLRYELLFRRVGNSAPVADAGPDQIGVAAGVIRLDGSASYDPDNDPLTFSWEKIAGPNVSISGMNSAQATFTAAEGQTYSFRLTVKDPGGLISTARVTVSTARALEVRILSFVAQPNSIRSGQNSTLIWEVENADSVEITPGIGRVAARGSTPVSPTQTTMYRLTARNASGERNATVTVTVERAEVRILRFEANPTNITSGEVSTLSWATENAADVSISGIGNVPVNGSRGVTPTQTTSYTLTARGTGGETVTSTVTVRVTGGGGPRIIRFTATPPEILPGEQSALAWEVENATQVTITGIGTVQPTGSSSVSPATSTTYTLTARNAQGDTSATAAVSVIAPVKILDFVADPASSPSSGAPVTLRWTTQNATEVVITGVGTVPVNGSTVVRPTSDISYTLLAYGKRSQASALVLVRVAGAPGGDRPPVADAGPNIRTNNNSAQLNGTGSFDPAGLPITFQWRFVSGPATATIAGATTATPTVQMPQFGDYIFELTVTNSRGLSGRAFVRVTFIDP